MFNSTDSPFCLCGQPHATPSDFIYIGVFHDVIPNQVIKASEIKPIIDIAGYGIPEEIQQSIFDPFFSTKVEEKGTGLGFVITNSILHKRNAEIKFTSGAGQGTRFILTFSAAQAVPVAAR